MIYFLYPVVAFAIAQGSKILFHEKKNHHLKFKDLFAYSSMPSSHTATVVSLAVIIGLRLGFGSAEFALAFVFCSVVITDAVGLRNYLGQHGRTLNILVKDLKEDDFLDSSYPKQLEHIGHTPLQVLVGGIIGTLVSVIGYLLF